MVARLDPGGPGNGRGTVWFDRRRLQPGDAWEADIVSALHGCQAAVLLLSPEALESPWVLREATVLADRRSRWPELCLVPVLFGGASRKTLSQHAWWAALDVTRWQPVQAPTGAFEGPDAASDINFIVEQVGQRMDQRVALPKDIDRPLQIWSQNVRSFLKTLADAQLSAQLDGASQALRLQPPPSWDADQLNALVQALFQSDVLELGEGGDTRYPLLEALAQLLPGQARSESELKLCERLELLAAPPGAAVAVGAAQGAAGGGRHAPVLLRAEAPQMATLAARRAACDIAKVVPLTGVAGEGAVLDAAALKSAARALKLAKASGRRAFVVTALQAQDDDDASQQAQQLQQQLPADAALVAVIGRAPQAPAPLADAPAGGAVLVTVPPDDEEAALLVAGGIQDLAGKAGGA
jgi:hypothetical protein